MALGARACVQSFYISKKFKKKKELTASTVWVSPPLKVHSYKSKSIILGPCLLPKFWDKKPKAATKATLTTHQWSSQSLGNASLELTDVILRREIMTLYKWSLFHLNDHLIFQIFNSTNNLMYWHFQFTIYLLINNGECNMWEVEAASQASTNIKCQIWQQMV